MRITIIMFVLLLVACAGQPFRWSDFDRVKDGMSEQEVLQIMGKPSSRATNGNIKALGWGYANITGAKAVFIQFRNDKVFGRSESGR